jgi:basic amino acid/polyamine antiporter, APA family
MPDSPAKAAAATTLVRGLTLVPATAIVVTNVIGVGVFMKARVMTCNVGTPEMVLLAYAVAGIFTIAGALTFAELATLMPRAGGQYNYIGAAFGRPWAYAYGWMATLIDGAASNAATAIGLVIFLNDFLGGTLSPAEIRWMTAGIIVAVTVLALASVRANGFFATVVTALKVLLVAGVGVAAFTYSDGTWGHFGDSGAAGSCVGVPAEARLGLVGFGAAIIGALWSYSGWSQVVSIAEEVQRPGWTLPRALVGGCVIIMALYLLINAGYFYVLSPQTIASVPETTSVAGELLVRLVGAAGASLLTIGLMVCSLGAVHSGTLIMSRVPYAMARDGLLPRGLGTVSPRTRVPVRATLLLAACAITYALSGTFDVITDLIVFVLLLFNGLSVASVYVLRRKLPHVPRPYRMWGYPVVPALFLAATVCLMANTLLATPGRALIGLGVVALGFPLYWYYARRLPPARTEDWLEGKVPIE